MKKLKKLGIENECHLNSQQMSIARGGATYYNYYLTSSHKTTDGCVCQMKTTVTFNDCAQEVSRCSTIYCQ